MPFLKSIFIRTRNVLRGPLKEKVVFVHVPKCGGTSLNNLFMQSFNTLDIRKDKSIVLIKPQATFNVGRLVHETGIFDPFENDYLDILKIEENLLLYYLSQEEVKYVAGHFAFSEIAYKEFNNKYSFVTLLRNPLERMISHYFYNRYKEGELGKTKKDITSYLASKRSKNQGHEYVKKFYGKIDSTVNLTSENAINQAKENLRKFSVVGCLEYPENLLEQLNRKFGLKASLPHKNTNPKSGSFKNKILTDEIKEQFKNICKPDMEIYKFVIENFVKTN